MRTSVSAFEEKLRQINAQQQDAEIKMINPDSEPLFVINSDSRAIQIPSQLRTVAVVGDNKAETLYFSIDRYFDDVDLFQKSCAIQYINANKEENISSITGKYLDETIYDRPKIIFGWVIDSDIAKKSGEVQFSIRFFSIDEDNRIDYSFNTTPAKVNIVNNLQIFQKHDVTNPDSTKFDSIIKKLDEVSKQISSEKNYSKLENKPQINGQILNGGNNDINGVIDYNSIRNHPVINNQEVVGNIILSYNSMNDLPTINGQTVQGNVQLDLTTNYEELNNLPTLNGTQIKGNVVLDLVENYADLSNKPIINGKELGNTLTLSYADLDNRPMINGSELDKDFTLTYADLNDKPSVNGKALSGEVRLAYSDLDNIPTIDAEILENSENAVQNKAVFAMVKTFEEELQSIKTSLGEMTYAPIKIENFNIDAAQIREKGDKITQATLSWTVNKTPNSLSLNDEPLNTSLSSFEINQEISNDYAFILNASDKRSSDSKTLNINFIDGVYYGVLQEKEDSMEIIPSLTNKIVNTALNNEIELTANENEYYYFAIPVSNTNVVFSVGGWSGGFELIDTVEYTNTYEYKTSYNIYKSQNSNLGTLTIQIRREING